MRSLASRFVLLVLTFTIFTGCETAAAQIKVRHEEGTVHGFLVLRTTDGETIASGDLTQIPRGNQITSHMVFHFRDGSLHDETAVFSQRGKFRLLKYSLVQKGPSFNSPQELSIDVAKGTVTVRYKDDGKEEVKTEHMKLPSDLANGLTSTLLKNLRPEDGEVKMSLLVATPKVRVVRLAVFGHGEDLFTLAGSKRKAMHWVIKFELGGITGLVAPVIGKQPPDIHVWVMDGEAPAFVREEGPLSAGGAIWRIELTSPVWPEAVNTQVR